MTVSFRHAPEIRSPANRSDIYGVHGTVGITGWKALYTRRDLHSPSEAVEWAVLPPGGVSGEHRHTRTEEVYLILNGQGDYFLNGKAYPVRPGTLALMTPGNSHGLRNTGHDALDWLVVETITLETHAILTGCSPPRSSKMLPKIVDLTKTPRFETTGVFQGPLTAVERHVCASGSHLSIQNDDHETACFLNRGSLTLRWSEIERHLSAPTSFLLPLGEAAQLAADSEIEMFTVNLRVPVR